MMHYEILLDSRSLASESINEQVWAVTDMNNNWLN